MVKRLAIFFVTIVIILGGFTWYKRNMSDPSLQSVPTFDKLQVIKTGSITLHHSINDISIATSITHGLGYRPIFSVYIVDPTSLVNIAIPYSTFSATGATSGLVNFSTYADVSDTQLQIGLLTPDWAGNNNYSTAYDLDFKYYLYRQTAQTQ